MVGRRPSAVSRNAPTGMFTRSSPTLRRPWYGVECRDGCRGFGSLMPPAKPLRTKSSDATRGGGRVAGSEMELLRRLVRGLGRSTTLPILNGGVPTRSLPSDSVETPDARSRSSTSGRSPTLPA